MKKIINIICSVFLLTIFMVNCQQENANVNMKALSNALNGTYSSEFATVQNSSNNEIMILSKTEPSSDAYTKSIILQMEQAGPQLKFSDNVEVVRFQFGILLKQNNELTFLGLSDQRGTELVTMIQDKIKSKINHVIYGFGYSVASGNWKLTVPETFQSAFGVISLALPNGKTDVIDPGAKKCNSGGAGSNACSIGDPNFIGASSCSVSCNAGYYACCVSSSVSCTCVKETSTTPPNN